MRAIARLAVLALLTGAVPAAAQPYIHGITGQPFFFHGGHLTDMPVRLITIDAATGQVIASLPLTGCAVATGVAVRADGLRVYVSCGAVTGRLLVIDPIEKQIVASRDFGAGVSASGVAVSPSGDRLVVPLDNGRADVLDAESLTAVGTILIGDGFEAPSPVVVSSDGTRAYFSQSTQSTNAAVVVGSLVDFTVATQISLPTGAGQMGLNPGGSRLVVGGRAVSIVDTATNNVVATFNGEAGWNGVAADAARAYANGPSGILAIDLTSGALAAQLPPAQADSLEMSAAGDRLYATVGATSTVATVNLVTGAVDSTTVVKGRVVDLAAPAASPAIAPQPCTYALAFRPGSFTSPPPRESPAGSTDWRIDVIALPDRCTWTAQSDVPWITMEYTSGTGPDNVGLTISPNTTGVTRVGTITIGGQTLTVSQAGCSNPWIFFDRPIAYASISQPIQISGWAIDTCSGGGTGIADPTGRLGYGRSRPDVAAAFGAQFVNSGFEFRDTFERLPGLQDIAVSFTDTLTGSPVSGTVRVNVLPSIAPFGVIDTPVEGATVSGDMALTGWVMDDVGLLGNVLVYRDALPGEGSSPATPGKVFIGVATRVPGARPDVQALYPSYADNDRAGFGLMILTNALPNGGNGTFTFHVQVADRYNAIWLGPRSVTIDNASSPLPFGAVDIPSPGQTVSGSIYVHGWALTPGTAMIPIDGSTIDVVVDGAVVGHPTYNQARPDVQGLFPEYTNSTGAGGYFLLDTTTLSNGLHTIAWVVRDNAGNAKGIGSRFFTVANP